MSYKFMRFQGVDLASTCLCENGQYMNLQSSIQGSLGEAEQLTTAIKFEVAYIPDILPTTTMLHVHWAKPRPPDIIITSQNRPDLPTFRAE